MWADLSFTSYSTSLKSGTEIDFGGHFFRFLSPKPQRTKHEQSLQVMVVHHPGLLSQIQRPSLFPQNSMDILLAGILNQEENEGWRTSPNDYRRMPRAIFLSIPPVSIAIPDGNWLLTPLLKMGSIQQSSSSQKRLKKSSRLTKP